MIFFTADLHLGHENIIKFENRPFDSIIEMNETLINNFNEVVKQNDIVYILGDLTYRIKKQEADELIARLNGKKVLVLGNHDIKYDPDLFEEICNYKELKYNKVKFCLMHFPIRSWNKMEYGSIHLHGHEHNKREYNQKMKKDNVRCFDVGVDANNYYPVSLKQIFEYIGINYQ